MIGVELLLLYLISNILLFLMVYHSSNESATVHRTKHRPNYTYYPYKLDNWPTIFLYLPIHFIIFVFVSLNELPIIFVAVEYFGFLFLKICNSSLSKTESWFVLVSCFPYVIYSDSHVFGRM